MLANGKLSKAIADMGFYEFRRQLEYRTQLYGSKLVIVDRFYPSSKTCSSCGEKKSSLSANFGFAILDFGLTPPSSVELENFRLAILD
jgi:hypothetical protein